ncbi:MAG: flagellar hook-associated protein 3 [Planctomycetes bacterium]|nr:flagellar hook-associated protein 3 [Planctomycetota bacterium]
MTSGITLETQVNSTLRKIDLNTSRMQELQEQISSGKKINKPSEDPSAARKIMSLNTERNKLDQYSLNTKNATEVLEFNASVLVNLADLINRVQELTVQGVSDTVDTNGRKIIASEIDAVLEDVLRNANSKHADNYTFAGTKTRTIPFTATRNTTNKISSVSFSGNRESIEYQVGPGMNVQVNQTGEITFVDNNLLNSIISIRDGLETGAITFVRNELDTIESAHDGILSLISKAGAVAKTLELTDKRIEETKLSVELSRAETESADIAELVLRLKEQENIFQATLASSTLIFRNTILDYL